VNTHGALLLENLSTANLMGIHHLARSLGDAAWNQLIQYCTYKAADAGYVIVLVDSRGVSQRCSGCGSVVQKELSVRVHDHPSCGLRINRDLNAAINYRETRIRAFGRCPRSPRVGCEEKSLNRNIEVVVNSLC
jgi:putative transposase